MSEFVILFLILQMLNIKKDYALSSYCAEFCNVSIGNTLPFPHVFFVDTAADSYKCNFHVAWHKRDYKLHTAETPFNIPNLLYRIHGRRIRLHPLSYDAEM